MKCDEALVLGVGSETTGLELKIITSWKSRIVNMPSTIAVFVATAAFTVVHFIVFNRVMYPICYILTADLKYNVQRLCHKNCFV